MDFRKMLVGSAGLGAGLMYLLDRQAGRRRRAAIRDKAVHGAHVTTDTTEKTTRDIRNRLQGIGAEVKHIFSREKVSDKVLVDRIRSDIGTVVSHPGSIQVEAINGHVRLTGVVLAAELENLLKRVESVRGVRDVVHELEVHETSGNVPGLQGEGSGRLSGGRFELMQENWSPAARLFTGAAGGVMVAYGLINRRLSGAAAAVVGLPLFARAATNMPLRRIVGAAGRRGVDIEKTIHIDAPVERVFETLTRVEDFPNFMTHVKKVSKLESQDRRYRWTVSGPAGTEVSWDSDFTLIIPNRQLAWRTAPKSMVKHAGIVKFDANPDGSTAVNIRLTYNPLIGGLGHALLTMLGADPKTLLDEDLLRAKTFMETRKQPRDAAARRSG
jgi:uncharacterized membrane protein